MYLDSLGSLVLFLTCAVAPALIAFLVVDDVRQRLFAANAAASAGAGRDRSRAGARASDRPVRLGEFLIA